MIFLNPNFILLMGLPLLILGFLIITNRKNLDNIFDSKRLEELTLKRNFLGKVGKNFTLFGVLTLFIIALARPVLPKNDITLTTYPKSFSILLDISNSMLADDVYPTRLEFAKKKIVEFLKQNYDANIAIYAFSDNLFQIAPKTRDKDILIYLIKNFSPQKSLQNSSNIQNAITHIKDRDIIIFSDLDFDSFKSDKNLKYFLCASKIGSAIKKDGTFITDKNGNIIISKPNPNISYETDLKVLLPKTKKAQTFTIKQKDELFYYPLLLATFLLMVTFLSFKLSLKPNILALILVFATFQSNSNALFFDFYHIYLAKKYYKQKRYKKSLEEFMIVANEKKSAQSYYDVANCYFMLKRYEQAYRYYIISQKLQDNEKVRHNIEVTKMFLPKKDLSSLATKTINVKQKSDMIKTIKQKTKLIEITNLKGKSSVSW